MTVSALDQKNHRYPIEFVARAIWSLLPFNVNRAIVVSYDAIAARAESTALIMRAGFALNVHM
ncbi:hypothetical protein NKI31_30975 [Mesorhizobium sp. M0659]|uniref:hypothetical protein n=1 Tax=Mesorhizobium sp. M0659 TaxID=2956980 RepID=UPI00333B1E8C